MDGGKLDRGCEGVNGNRPLPLSAGEEGPAREAGGR
jgi:hypothetical protein